MIELLLAQLLNFDNAYNEKLGALCENNNRQACALLVTLTQGQCAGPQGSGCAYDLTIVNPTEPMVTLTQFPHLGASRVSTIQHCNSVVGKAPSQLLTDIEFDKYEYCLSSHT
jgi:hypothetical protein